MARAPDSLDFLPVVQKSDLPLDWQGEHPVLCLAGRTPDEAAAVLFAQLSNAHGLGCTG